MSTKQVEFGGRTRKPIADLVLRSRSVRLMPARFTARPHCPPCLPARPMRDDATAVRRRAVGHIPAAAIGMIVGAVLCFSILDGAVKSLVPRYPVTLLVWVRYGVQALAMLVWFGPSLGVGLLRTSTLRLQIVRALILVLSSVFFV